MFPLQTLSFTCPRTCPAHGNFWCRFRPLLDAIGPHKVNSHTVKVAVDFTDAAILEDAVRAIGARWLGVGTHKLFSGRYTGIGFQFQEWRYPCILESNGNLAYDNYGGDWGNESELERLKGAYVVAKAERTATELGWQFVKENGSLTVYHPSGGTMTIAANGIIDANGFVGHSCHDAIVSLGMPITDAQIKPEYGAVAATIAVSE